VLEGVDNLVNVDPGQLETASNTLLVPTLRPHPNYGPARLIGIFKVVKVSEFKLELHGNGVLLEKLLDGDMIGFVAKFAFNDLYYLTVVDRGIQLLEGEDFSGDRFRICMRFPTGFARPLVRQSKHAVLDEALGFFPDPCPLNPGLTAAFRDCFREQHNGPDHLILVLNWVREFEPELSKFLRWGHCLLHWPSDRNTICFDSINGSDSLV
jgi:hypothetical protein